MILIWIFGVERELEQQLVVEFESAAAYASCSSYVDCELEYNVAHCHGGHDDAIRHARVRDRRVRTSNGVDDRGRRWGRRFH